MDLKQFKSDAAATLAPAAPTYNANNYGYPTEGGSGVLATVPGAYWFYQLLQEFENVIRGSYSIQTEKLMPDANSLTQLRDSINRLITQGIANGTIGNSNIADNSVTTPKIANNAVTADKISNGSIDKTKLNLGFHEFSYASSDSDGGTVTFFYYIRPENDFLSYLPFFSSFSNRDYRNRFFSAPTVVSIQPSIPADPTNLVIDFNFPLIKIAESGYKYYSSNILGYYYNLDINVGQAEHAAILFKQYCIDINPNT